MGHRVRLCAGLLALLVALAPAAFAADFVTSSGRLSDTDFYRLVSCGAAPGQACRAPAARWPDRKQRDLRIGFAQRDAGFPDTTARAIRWGLNNAIAQINRSGANLRLTEAPPGTRDADILLYLQDIPQGGRIRGTGLPGLDGTVIEIARFHVLWNGQRQIYRAGIVFSADLLPREAASVVMEEIVQSLGLIWDIRNPAYRGRSIFDEDSNLVSRLRGQDAMALRMHYPGAPS